MGKVILDTGNLKESNTFVLNLKGLEKLNNVNLDKAMVIEEIKEDIKNNDFSLGEERVKLLIKLSDYGDRNSDFTRVEFYYRKIKFNNLNKRTVKDHINLFLEISSFISYYISLRNEDLSENFEGYINEIKEIEGTLKVNELLEDRYIINKNLATVEEIDLIKKYLEKNKKTTKELKEKLQIALEEGFNKLKTLDEKEAVEFIRNLFENKCEEEFFSSVEFLNITLKNRYKEFENYNDLLDFVNKEYLLYRFNESKNLSEKADILIELFMDDYINLSRIEREIIVNKLMIKKERYNLLEEVKDLLLEEIKDFKTLDQIRFVPIRG